MPKEKQLAIARKGGKAVQASGRGHRWTPAEAQAAGRIGGRSKKKKAA